MITVVIADDHVLVRQALTSHLEIEGDIEVFMQHHYALWRMLKLLREEGR